MSSEYSVLVYCQANQGNLLWIIFFPNFAVICPFHWCWFQKGKKIYRKALASIIASEFQLFRNTHSSLSIEESNMNSLQRLWRHMKLVHQNCMRMLVLKDLDILFRFYKSSAYDLLHLLHLLKVRDLEILFHLPSKLWHTIERWFCTLLISYFPREWNSNLKYIILCRCHPYVKTKPINPNHLSI